ncbi:MAG: hypothetical protein V4655_04890 [Bdellovibrionota bacterium]
MTCPYPRKLGFARLFSIVCGVILSFSSYRAEAAKLSAYLMVKWEGRALEEPNLDALDAFRKKFPDVPVIHLINPTYFKENAKLSGDNLEAIKKRIGDQDEVGLYLVPSGNLLRAADVMPLRKPTFWSYSEEICTTDCGLSVPLTAYSRADVAKLVFSAHSIMSEFGFSEMQSFAVHGFVAPAGIQSLAQSLGYANDLTAVDKTMLKNYLKEYPVGQWIASSEESDPVENLKTWTQAGGVVEFTNDDEVIKRFTEFFKKDSDKSDAFIVSVSQENVFMNSLRLEKTIKGMREQAAKGNDELVFDVMTKGKKGRPIAKNKSINRKS